MPAWPLIFLGGIAAVSALKVASDVLDRKAAGQWGPALMLFGGRPVVPPVEASLTALDQYARASGVQAWTAETLATPHNRSVAQSLGYAFLVPPLELFPAWVTLAAVAQTAAQHAPSGVTVRNLYRPEDYNEAVGGEGRRSYHVTAQAVDMDFEDRDERRAFERWLRALQCKNTWLKMGIGSGRKTLHVDLLGTRSRPWNWWYDHTDGVTDCDGPSGCRFRC